jgi:phospholipid/cholesterol/gamma-HCH transport system ATP-binding protein
MMEAHIVLKDVQKSFGPKHVLRGLSVSVRKGRSLVVIGGSGTGKSVMLKCILGIIRPDAGEIIVGGQNCIGLRGRDRDEFLSRFGMLFQGAALFDSLSVWENVAFGLIQGRGVARSKAREVAIEKLGQVGLSADVGALYPPNSPAACRSVSVSRAPSRLIRKSSSSTNRLQALIPSWPISSMI